MPKGQLRHGLVKVSGVTTIEVKCELIDLLLERDLRSMSEAVGVALVEWFAFRRGAHPAASSPMNDPWRAGVAAGVLNPPPKVLNPPPGEGDT